MNNRATVISDKSAAIPTREFVIVGVPQKSDTNPMPSQSDNPLRDLVQTVMRDRSLSYKDVEMAARENGGTLGRATIQQIANGVTTNPGVFTLVELAWGLGLTVERVVTVALGDHLKDATAFEKSELANIWDLSRQLPSAEQKILKRFVQMLEREIRRLLGSQ